MIDAAPRLRVISNYAVGVDNIDVEAATERGIPVGYTPDVLTEATADLPFALMLAARAAGGGGRRRWCARGAGSPGSRRCCSGRDVHWKTLGIVGMGRIGNAVARRLEGFGMEVLHTGRSGGVPLDELLERSDFVSAALPAHRRRRAG